MNIFDILTLFEDRINTRKERRAKTEYYLSLIREQILITRLPHTPVRPMYKILKETKGCDFTYQYFMKLVESNWNTILDDSNRCCIVVSSEKNKLCRW